MRSLDAQPTVFRHLAGNKSKRAAADIEQSGRFSAIAAELFHDDTRIVRQVERRAIDEANADFAAGRGLYDVAAANWVAGFDLKRIAARARKRAHPHDAFDLPDDQCRARRRLCKAGRLLPKRKTTMAGHWPRPSKFAPQALADILVWLRCQRQCLLAGTIALIII